MKKLINIANPENVIIVQDAYINGDRIVCNAGSDDFDLWRSKWSISDMPPMISMLRYACTVKKAFPTVPDEFWEGLGADDLDNLRIEITKEESK